jgi:hypothetical protein
VPSPIGASHDGANANPLSELSDLASTPRLPSSGGVHQDPLGELGNLASAPRMPPEPWYYRFLQVTTTVFLWINVAGVAFGFLCWLGWIVFALIGAAGLAGAPHLGENERAMVGSAVFVLLLASLPYLVGLAMWLLVSLMACGWSFLALDAARNLRVVRYATRS